MLNINWASISTIAFEETIRSSLNEILSEIPQTILDTIRDKFDSSFPSNPGLSSPTLSPLAGLVLSKFTFGSDSTILSIPTILPATKQHIDSLLSSYNPSSKLNHVKVTFPELPDEIYNQLKEYCDVTTLTTHTTLPINGIGTCHGNSSMHATNYTLDPLQWGAISSYSMGIPMIPPEQTPHNLIRSSSSHAAVAPLPPFAQEQPQSDKHMDMDDEKLSNHHGKHIHGRVAPSNGHQTPQMRRSAKALLATFHTNSSHPTTQAVQLPIDKPRLLPCLDTTPPGALHAYHTPTDHYSPDPLNFDTILCFDVEYSPTRSLAIALDTTLQLQSPLQLLALSTPLPPHGDGVTSDGSSEDALNMSNSSFTLHPQFPPTPQSTRQQRYDLHTPHHQQQQQHSQPHDQQQGESYFSSALSMAGRVLSYLTPQKRQPDNTNSMTTTLSSTTATATPNQYGYQHHDALSMVSSRQSTTTSTPNPKMYKARQWRAANPALLFSPERSQFIDPSLLSRQNSESTPSIHHTPSRHGITPRLSTSTPYSTHALNTPLNASFTSSVGRSPSSLPSHGGQPTPLISLPIRIGIERLNIRCKMYIIVIHSTAMKQYLSERFNAQFFPIDTTQPIQESLRPVICVVFVNPDDLPPLPIQSYSMEHGVDGQSSTLTSSKNVNTVTTDIYNPLETIGESLPMAMDNNVSRQSQHQQEDSLTSIQSSSSSSSPSSSSSSSSSWPITDLKVLITLGDQKNQTAPEPMRMVKVPQNTLDQSKGAISRGVTITRLRAVEGFIVQRLSKTIRKLIQQPLVISHDYGIAAKENASEGNTDPTTSIDGDQDHEPSPHQYIIDLVTRRIEAIQKAIIDRKAHYGDGFFHAISPPLVQRHGLAFSHPWHSIQQSYRIRHRYEPHEKDDNGGKQDITLSMGNTAHQRGGDISIYHKTQQKPLLMEGVEVLPPDEIIPSS